MFDIGWSELLVIVVVAIVVVGPKELPKLMRSIGHYGGKLRRAAGDFQRQFEEAMRASEIEEVKKAIASVQTETPALDLKAPIEKPLMLPKLAPGRQTEAPAKPKAAPGAGPPTGALATPKSARKRGPAKPKPNIEAKTESDTDSKPASAKRGKKRAEPAP
jgi:sec-independent protein translocase protein TatB